MPNKQKQRYKRHKRVRAKIKGTAKIPRLCVFRSNKHIYAQLINDEKGKTLISSNDMDIKKPKTNKDLKGKLAIAFQVGQILAKKAVIEKFEKVVFDRGGYKYHGRIKALADGTRESGLKF